jgi:ADP-ribosylglycohydrolase
MSKLKKLTNLEAIFNDTAEYKQEMGSTGIEEIIEETEKTIQSFIDKLNNLEETVLPENEPSDYESIESLYSLDFSRGEINEELYLNKLKGAMFGRFAGCSLGAPVEFATAEQMELLSQILQSEFPPVHYWKEAPQAFIPRYSVGFAKEFTLGNIEFLSPDDDIIYTLISLLVIEEYGLNFTTEDLANTWMKYIPAECTYTAERAAIDNLYNGMKLPEATLYNNPYTNWIGGFIRCDGYGYVNPLDPKRAAKMAYQDVYLTHRKSGLYSAMFFAAVISMAFADRPLMDIFNDALKLMPPKSSFYKAVEWALDVSDQATDYRTAVDLVKEKFAHISPVHAENNACLTIFGALIGEHDFTKGIGHTVAMGFDNDCTAATVGSILGAHLGIDRIDPEWYIHWNNKVKTYLKGNLWMDLDDIINRFNKTRINLDKE